MPRIHPHSKLGLNPRMEIVHCFACGEEKSDAIAFLGRANYYDVCPTCGCRIYGGAYNKNTRLRECPKCKYNDSATWERVELEEHEHLHRNGICRECRELMEKGIILISVDESKTTDKTNPYRTGGWAVITDAGFDKLEINPPELREAIRKKRMCFIPDDAWKLMGLDKVGEVDNRKEKT